MLPLRFHHLKALGRSPAHAKLVLDGEEAEQTASMERGSALHHMVFGTRPVIAYPGAVRRGKEWEAFRAGHPDCEILAGSDYERVQGMAEAVRAHADAMQVLEGVHESTIMFDILGRRARVTPDCRAPEHVAELKSTTCSDPMRFQWQAIKLGYHCQLVWQLDGVALSGLGQPKKAYVVAVESSAPYPVTVLRLTDRALDQGRRQVRLWLERFLACEKWDTWPGYVESIVDLDVPDDEELPLTYGTETEAA